jgi:hypothetical protein
MRLTRLLLVLTLVAISAHLALAGDIVAMPTGNMMPANTLSLGYIYWKTAAAPTPPSIGKVRDYINVGELFYGVTNRLEIDGLLIQPQGWGKVAPKNDLTELNIYYAAIPEKYGKSPYPSLIVGATNLTQSDWLPSRGRPLPPHVRGDNRISPFALTSYNVLMPVGGPPSWNKPLVRLHLGYGTGWHDNRFFGGAQVLVNPKYGAAVLNYQGYPAYLAHYSPRAGWDLDAGWDHGWPLGHVAYTKKF